MKILVIDVGGTHVKLLATGHRKRREFRSGAGMTAARMVTDARRVATGTAISDSTGRSMS
jgi:polyphosphate glucokinase